MTTPPTLYGSRRDATLLEADLLDSIEDEKEDHGVLCDE